MRTNRVLALASLAIAVLMVASTFGGVVGKDGEKAEKVIVLFKDSIDEDLIKAKGGSIDHKYSIIPAVVTKLTPNAIEALKKSDKVRAVDKDATAIILGKPADKPDKPDKPGKPPKDDPPPPQPDQVQPWGIARINADDVWASSTGSSIKVALLDTGIDKDHPDLEVAGGFNAFRGNRNRWDDDHNHGTHCAGIIAAQHNEIGSMGVAPAVSLYGVKVLNQYGSGPYDVIIRGIEWAVDNGMNVISMSLGGYGYSASMEAACDAAVAAGIVVVAASGNWGDVVAYPAAFESVIAVSATDSDDDIGVFSNPGPEVDLAAPGVAVYSTVKDGYYATWDGTSMACPHVTGTVALLLEDWVGDWTVAEVKAQLTDYAYDLGPAGHDNSFGYGLVDALASYNNL